MTRFSKNLDFNTPKLSYQEFENIRNIGEKELKRLMTMLN